MKKNVLLVFVSVVLLSAMLPITKESTSFSEATIYVDPSTNDVSVGNTFVINVSLADYVWLQNFEFYLGYDTTILDGLNVLVPPPYMAPVEPQINDTEGYVHVIAVHEGPIPSSASASESFPLASITFKATAVGSSILNLYDTLLFGGLGTYINHTTVDGSVTVSSGIITVPDDYPTIQEAINNANDGDTIFVYNGTYHEHVTINKSISLVGENKSTAIIDGSRNGTVIFVTADHVSISGLTIQNGYYIPHITYGIKVGGWQDCCNNVAVHGNIISDNDIGIFVYYSSNCVIFDNVVFNNFRGIDIVLSNDNQIKGNSLFSNGEGVVVGSDANSNMIRDNEIYSNDFGIHVGWSRGNNIVGNEITLNAYAGIRFDSSTNNSIIGNTITLSNRDGIVLFGSDSNIITRNELIQNKWDGMAIWYSHANIIYHNNFRDNVKQAGSYSGSITSWDDGYPSGGNYWSNYVGNDTYSGPFQNETGSDGIGDTPYIVDENNQDNYPLMSPWGPVHNTNTGLHYQTIQAAINAPETLDRHTILVDVGTYYEHVSIDKNGLRLIGENRSTTIIDGNGTGSPISIIADSVTVTGFKIRNSRFEYLYAGIRVDDCNHNNITGNTMMNNIDGIFLTYSSNNTISNNIIINNDWNGIHLKYNSNHNVISSNTLLNNRNGINIEVNSNNNHVLNNYIADSEWDGIDLIGSQNNNIKGNTITKCFTGIYLGSETDNMNAIYHNNFINNMYQVTCYSTFNMWDDGYPSGGNYWSDYTGVDVYSGPNQNETGSDGIGDKSHIINTDNTDRYPLMGPISFFNAGTWDETTYYVHTVSNSTVSDFYFSKDDKLVSFNVTGPDETAGFCRVAIPNELLWCDNPEQWQVWVNNTLIEDKKITEDPHYTHIYFTYNHSSQNVEVIGVHVTPEFPTWTSMLLILIMLTVAIAIYKRRIPKTPIH